METIKVVQAVYALCMGGSEILAQCIAGALNRSGRYACAMYGVDQGGPMAEVLATEGIPFRSFSRTGKLDLRLIYQLVKQFRVDNIQLVHTHHLCQLMYAGVAGRLAGARLVHTEHEFYTISRPMARRLSRLLSMMADAVTGVTPEVTNFLHDQIGIPAVQLRTIPNGVDVARFQSARPISRAELGWGEEDVVIGCVARLEPEKGHMVLLDAFRQVHRRYPHARLLLVGDGSQRERLQKTAAGFGLEGSARFLGSRSDVPALLATCDVTTLASSREGLPMVLLEAMAAGKPVVATRVGSVPEVLQDGRSGLLVPSGDTAALAAALAALIADPQKRAWMGGQALDVVTTHYGFTRSIEQYMAVYEAALSRGRN